MAKKKEVAFDAAKWLAKMRQMDFEFRLLGIVGQPETLKVRYWYPTNYEQWVCAQIVPLVIANKPALVAQLLEEGRERQAAQPQTDATSLTLRLVA